MKKATAKYALAYTALILVFITLVQIFIRLPSVNEKVFVNGICRYYNVFATFVFGKASFSVAEILIISAVSAVIVSIILIAALLLKKRKRAALKTALGFLNFFLTAVFLYTAVTSPLYRRSDMYSVLDLSFSGGEAEMAECAAFYNNELNKLSPLFERDGEGNVICPYTEKELFGLIGKEIDKTSENSGYFFKNKSSAKVFLSSSAVNYLSVSGMYFSLTGEATVSRKTPAYSYPALIAHELAHSKGVMRENDANFLAYYALINSENDYLRYAGFMKAAAISLNALYGSGYYEEICALMSETTKKEYKNAADFYRAYEGFISKIGDKINDAYLKSNGVSGGTLSYSETEKALCALYYCKLK